MIKDNELALAVAKILQRSERQTDIDKLIASFVDMGIIPQIKNTNNQIIYGRRGTGKTHIFHVLQQAMESEGFTGVYIDARTLGSTSQFSDEDIPVAQRCLALFRDILNPIHNSLIEHIIERSSPDAEKALDSADMLLQSINEPVTAYAEQKVERISGRINSVGKSAAVDICTARQSASMSLSSQKEVSEQQKSTISVSTFDKVIFPNLHHCLSNTLKLGGIKLIILLDEWSTLPLDIQPYLAEFIKRGIIPVADATIKIAALEHRSMFAFRKDSVSIGFELGADISVSQDLDDSYVFDRNPDHVTNLYSDIIYRHLCLEMKNEVLSEKYKVNDGKTLQSRMFSDKNTFKELSRAAEGVIRDLINIFNIAFFAAQRKGQDKIDKKSVIEAARKWFEQDKANNLDEPMRSVLTKIVDVVIGERRAKSFLLHRELEKHPMIQKLFDARVIHHIQRGYADKDNPGIRYNIYTLDYGTYVDLIGTSKQPQIEMHEDDGSGEIVVPFDDKRSIRRIILNSGVLEP